MSALESMRVGIVVERREIESRWADFTWEPVAVIPGAAPLESSSEWLPLRSGEGCVRLTFRPRGKPGDPFDSQQAAESANTWTGAESCVEALRMKGGPSPKDNA